MLVATYESPHASHLVALDGLANGLLVFGIFTLEGVAHEILVDQDIGVESVLLLEGLHFDIIALRFDAGRRHLGCASLYRGFSEIRCMGEW